MALSELILWHLLLFADARENREQPDFSGHALLNLLIHAQLEFVVDLDRQLHSAHLVCGGFDASVSSVSQQFAYLVLGNVCVVQASREPGHLRSASWRRLCHRGLSGR